MSLLVVLLKFGRIDGRFQSCRHLRRENLKVLAYATKCYSQRRKN